MTQSPESIVKKRQQRRVLTGLALLVLVALSPSGYERFRRFMKEDAFASLRNTDRPDQLGMRIQDVTFRQFKGAKLVNVANAERIDTMRDRNHVRMYGIKDGLYDDSQQRFRYQANIADWSDWENTLYVEGGVHISNKQVDIRSWSARFESNKNLLIATGEVSGRIDKGQIIAKNLTYNTKTKGYHAGPIAWTGLVTLDGNQDPKAEPAKPRRSWNFKSETTDHAGTGSDETTYNNAIATDGEIFVVAPKIVYRRKDDSILATGRVQYFSAKSNLVSDQAEVFRKEKRAIFTGNVEMVTKAKKDQKEKGVIEPIPPFRPLLPSQVSATKPPAPDLPDAEVEKDKQVRDSKNIRDYPLVMVSDKIEYWYAKGSRRAVITGNPQARQELPEGRWRHVWSNVGLYDGEKEILRLVSTKDKKDTRMKNSIGDDAVADWLSFSTKEDDDTFNGGGIVADVVSLEKDDDELRSSPAKAPPATNPPPKKTPPPKFPRI